MKVCTVVGRGDKSLLRGPGSELRPESFGEGERKRAKILIWMRKIKENGAAGAARVSSACGCIVQGRKLYDSA